MAYILRLSSFVRDFFLPGPKILSLREAFKEEEKTEQKWYFTKLFPVFSHKNISML